MYKRLIRSICCAALTPLLTLPVIVMDAHAAIDGVEVSGVLTFTAMEANIDTPDGGSHLMWTYAGDSGLGQYPGPTLIVEQGSTVTIVLNNELDVPVSIVFPGQTGVTAVGGPGSQDGLLTREALPGGSVVYSFTATHAGTYMYHSGTRPELQVEMGLLGAIIVRPTGYSASSPRAYAHADSSYDREFLFLLTEMDAIVHSTIQFEGLSALDSTDYMSDPLFVYWFINGRAAPDTLLPTDTPLLPAQPYNSLPRMHPGEKVLLRVIGGGKDQHPFHAHGSFQRVIATNGRLRESTAGAGTDLATDVFTIDSMPGQTVDAIFEWTGKDLGFDIYGTGPGFAHTCSNGSCPDTSPSDGFDDGTGAACYDETTHEYCPDHDKPLPVTLPDIQEMTIGPFYSGSAFLGKTGFLPPDHTSFNPTAAFSFPWHSHAEKELANFDIFPGGMLTFLFVEPHDVTIP